MSRQKTIREPIEIQGKGIHTGCMTTMRFLPAAPNHGYSFCRVDLPGKPIVRALAQNVFDTSRGTSIREGDAIVRTVEHVLAAVLGCDLDNIMIEINSEETPILDGSSAPFTNILQKAGIVEQDAIRIVYNVQKKVYLKDTDKDVEMWLVPDDGYRISTMVDYNSKVLSSQNALLKSVSDFNAEFSKARTFVFLSEVEMLLQRKLIQGGDIKNAVVFVDRMLSQEELDHLAKVFNQPKVNVLKEGVLNNIELNYPNEPARHKTLDVFGDLCLVGCRFTGHVIANKPGHKTNVEFAKMIQNQIQKTYGIEIA
ncbi:MAG TPA: UDP-3-O-acyl-N-acetylglucosamine deacetylase [Bacteroidales bacterium]|nr:UDP-3-O-acyl-N-acetylglucosamine deacetylase [Bacteroidales bacterium]